MILWIQSGFSKLGQLRCHNPQFVLWTQKCIMNYISKCFFFLVGDGIMNVDFKWINSLKSEYLKILWNFMN
jgi:hypothetical protein